MTDIELGRFALPLARDIIGEESAVPAALQEVLGEPFEECFAVRASASLLLGLRLAGGRRVAVRLTPAREPRDRP